MNITERQLIMQRWNVLQHNLIPEIKHQNGGLTPKLEKLIHLLDWVRIEEFVRHSWQGVGRKPHDRMALANAFVAKAVLGLNTTAALIERLTIDRSLRRICGFEMWKRVPNEATFSRAFSEFAHAQLAEKVHAILVKHYLGNQLIGSISRDGTAIMAREKPNKTKRNAPLISTQNAPKACRGRPKKGEVRPAKIVPESKIAWQMKQCLSTIISALPNQCDRGTKCNAQGYKVSWNGYKLHIDTAECGVVISALLTSASVHDSQAAVPLSMMSASKITNLYDLMDAAYCSEELKAHSVNLGHVPLIDHNPRNGEKKVFAPHEQERYKERSQAERTNSRLKDEFGGTTVRVRGAEKVMSHLMFGILALTADQLMRLFA